MPFFRGSPKPGTQPAPLTPHALAGGFFPTTAGHVHHVGSFSLNRASHARKQAGASSYILPGTLARMQTLLSSLPAGENNFLHFLSC